MASFAAISVHAPPRSRIVALSKNSTTSIGSSKVFSAIKNGKLSNSLGSTTFLLNIADRTALYAVCFILSSHFLFTFPAAFDRTSITVISDSNHRMFLYTSSSSFSDFTRIQRTVFSSNFTSLISDIFPLFMSISVQSTHNNLGL